MPATLDDLPTPALLLDLDALEGNLRRMARRADELDVALRPHVKTHKCVEVARRQRQLGGGGITVATLYEARAFAANGFDDITWAFPVIPSRVPQAAEIADGVTLRLVADDPGALDALEAAGRPFHVWVKVDCGYGRAGVAPDSDRAVELARRIAASDTLRFDGLLTHGGQAYRARGEEELAAAAEEERSVMARCARRLRSEGLAVPGVSVGSTPGMSGARDLEGVTEARPGNYAFYDYTQTVIGSCRVADCALTVLATVVSSQPGADHSVVDAGALSLSKDAGPDDAPRPSMGRLFEDYGERRLHPTARLRSLSQEHGIVTERLPWGAKVRVLPNHSCLTAACFDEYHVVRGRELVGRWKIWRGRD